MAEHAVEVADWLRQHGYGTGPYDLCWLNCPHLGYLKTYRGREICLCFAHAQVLESGKRGGSYRQAGTPDGCPAEEWPWRTAVAVALV